MGHRGEERKKNEFASNFHFLLSCVLQFFFWPFLLRKTGMNGTSSAFFFCFREEWEEKDIIWPVIHKFLFFSLFSYSIRLFYSKYYERMEMKGRMNFSFRLSLLVSRFFCPTECPLYFLWSEKFWFSFEELKWI